MPPGSQASTQFINARAKVLASLLQRHELHQAGVLAQKGFNDGPQRLEHQRRAHEQHLAYAFRVDVEHEPSPGTGRDGDVRPNGAQESA